MARTVDPCLALARVQVAFVLMERKCLSAISHAGIVRLYFSFQVCGQAITARACAARLVVALSARTRQDGHYLYMVMELCVGGELLHVIRRSAEAARSRGLTDTACDRAVAQ